MALYCELENIITESDVEQKFIYPFLKAETPIGLGLKDSEILTKHKNKSTISRTIWLQLEAFPRLF